MVHYLFGWVRLNLERACLPDTSYFIFLCPVTTPGAFTFRFTRFMACKIPMVFFFKFFFLQRFLDMTIPTAGTQAGCDFSHGIRRIYSGLFLFFGLHIYMTISDHYLHLTCIWVFLLDGCYGLRLGFLRIYIVSR